MKKRRVIFIFGLLWSMVLCSLSACKEKETIFIDAQEERTTSCSFTDEEEISLQTQTESADEEDWQLQPVIVHVCGAVVSPGVYELEAGSRVIDAVNLAGGLLADAAQSHINLAKEIADGEQIIILTMEEVKTVDNNISREGTSNGKININTADRILLCTLPGIGQTKAESIIAYREAQGGFATIEDIMKVSGIKENGFQKIKDLITVN